MDDTTRRVGTGNEFPGRGDEFRGRGEEQVRDYASTTPSSATTSSSGATGAAADLDEDTSRRAREIESEIAHTRAEMSETIEAIQEKLRPANLVSDATERVKSATTEKVKNMADTASETAQDVMRGSRERAYDMVEGAKQNPIPALMIGAGVAWLLMGSRNRGSDYSDRGWSQYSSRNTRGAYAGGDDYYRSTEADYSDVDDSSRYGYNRASSSSRYGDSRYTGGSQYGYGNEGWTSGTSRGLSDAGDTARQTVRRTSNQLQRMLRDNPLLVGAAAVLAGAAIGASLPETDRENQLMGEARDSVVDRAQEAAREAANTVKEAASDPVGTVSKVAEVVSDKKSS